MSACSVSSVDLRPVQIYNRARSTCEVAGRLTWVEMFSVGAGTNWSAHSDFQHAQANAIWLGLGFRIKLFIRAQVSVGASICSAELTTVIVAVISSSCSSSNCSLERHKCDCFYFQQRIFHHGDTFMFCEAFSVVLFEWMNRVLERKHSRTTHLVMTEVFNISKLSFSHQTRESGTKLS